jgi:hypothetical protein
VVRADRDSVRFLFIILAKYMFVRQKKNVGLSRFLLVENRGNVAKGPCKA